MELRLKIKLSIFVFLSFIAAQAQNTFPANGNVGIGTTTPSYLFDVIKTSNDAVIRSKTTTAGAYVFLDSYIDGYYGLNLLSNGQTKWFLGGYGTTDFTISKQMGSSELFRINSLGNVGIGTYNPIEKLQVVGVGVFGSNGYGLIRIGRDDGTYLHIENTTSDRVISLDADAKYIQSGYNTDFQFANNTGIWNHNGSVGIGTTSPNARLDVVSYTNDNSDIFHITNHGQYLGFSRVDATGAWSIQGGQVGNNDILIAPTSGNVGIGTTTPTEKLSVNGNIKTKKLIVTQNGWADYVFNDKYYLRPLTQLANFIKENRHLPDVPIAKDVEKNGVDVGEMQALLLKKIEELTLYMIEQNKKTEDLIKENNEMKLQLRKFQIQINEKSKD